MHNLHSKWRKPKNSRSRKRSKANKKKIKNYWRKNKSENSTKKTSQQKQLDDQSKKNVSSSEKKISFFEKSECASEEELNQYFIIHSSTIDNLIPKCFCESCDTVTTVTFQCGQKRGFASEFKLICDNCEEIISKTFTSQRVSSSQKSSFDVNKRMVDSFLKVGAGFSSLVDFSASMHIEPMTSNAYYVQLNAIKSDFAELKKSILEESRNVVIKVHSDFNGKKTLRSQVIDILASYDGSWQKRGHTSLYGLGCVIDVFTGLVVDYELLSKYCHLCVKGATDLGSDSPEFFIWQEGHKKSGDCCENYSGSSGSMELKCAEIMWQRSVKECGLRYTTMLSDGDSKTLKHLTELKVYDTPIIKEECLNHVAKRLFTALTELVKVNKVKGITLGGRKKGALTAQVISRLSNYYRSAIVRNAPDVRAMKQDILATLSHCASTDEDHDHSSCPTGVKSWCFFNKATALGNEPPSHNTMQVILNKEVVKHMKTVYDRLTTDELLKRCTQGLTQNANEALHSVIWRKCPKTVFVSKGRLDYAVANAIAEFNMGKSKAAECLANARKEVLPAVSHQILEKRDNQRKRTSQHKNEPEVKKRRMQIKYNKRTKDKSVVQSEGITYGAGQF